MDNLDSKAKELAALEKKLGTLQAALAKKQEDISKRESDLKDAQSKQREERQNLDAAQRKLRAEQDALEVQWRKLSDARTALDKQRIAVGDREKSVAEAERARDAGFAEDRDRFDAELAEKRRVADVKFEELRAKQKETLECEYAEIQKSMVEAAAKAESAERDRIRAQIASEREAWDKEHQAAVAAISAEREKLAKEQIELVKAQQDFAKEKGEVEDERARLEDKDARLDEKWSRRKAKLDLEVEELFGDRIEKYKVQIKSLQEANADVREALMTQHDLLEGAETLKHMLGDRAPQDVIRELNSKTDELKRLSEELATRPTEEMRQRSAEIERRLEALRKENEGLRATLSEKEHMASSGRDSELRVSDLEASLAQSKRNEDLLAREVESLNIQLQRYINPAENKKAREERILEMETPLTKRVVRKSPSGVPQIVEVVKHSPWAQRDLREAPTEMEWLDDIYKNFKEYDFVIERRLLEAFHTSLKSAEMSPLTVLAGVSGTGKSQLPKWYSYFGGIFFESVSVQSNWDSQESMLGYFNSIDNHFDAQPILRFLAQAQHEKRGDYPTLRDYVCLVLLDEMNLAHPELYFAEFLSKLEQRRGDSAIPFIDVKLGSGQAPEPLRLRRNILWTGTMNQDETTKSLSDKVLDRSNMIFFPRPTKLERRVELKKLSDDKRKSFPLEYKVWAGWLDEGKSLFTDDQIEPYKQILETVNAKLADVGRAIGHRVWQSVETYMSLYPKVREARLSGNEKKLNAAMHDAFEDQLVLKVMPKLRGIETRGIGEDALSAIMSVLNDKGFGSLADDFGKACELGHGQFMWQTASYLHSEQVKAPAGIGNGSSIKIEVSPSQQESGTSDEDQVAEAKSILEEYAMAHNTNAWELSSDQIHDAMKCKMADVRKYMDICKSMTPTEG